MPSPDIFLSYSREDRRIARRFADALEAAGFSVWWDNILHPGETFDEVIEHNLRSSAAVVCLWSPRAVNSRWVRAEATLGDRIGKLVPVIVETCNLPLIFELTHTLDLTAWDGSIEDERWLMLLDDLRRLARRQEDRALRDGAAALLERVWPAPEPALSEVPPPRGAADVALADVLAAAPGPQDADPGAPTVYATRCDDAALFGTRELHVLEPAGDAPMAAGKGHPVGPLGLRIGRSAPADLVVADPRVSRSHCLVELTGDELMVSDLKSTNGTFVDGERVDGAAPLPVGSVLRVGSLDLRHAVIPAHLWSARPRA